MVSINSMNLNGASVVGGVTVANFSASFSKGMNGMGGIQNFTENISDNFSYSANKEICDSDYEEFKMKAREYGRKTGMIEDGEESI